LKYNPKLKKPKSMNRLSIDVESQFKYVLTLAVKLTYLPAVDEPIAAPKIHH
jgi:hypothetical protein